MSEAQTAFDVGDNTITPVIGDRGITRGSANEPLGRRHNQARETSSGLPRIPFFHLLVLLLLYSGWVFRSDLYLTPEQGIGYSLGVTGGTMLLLLMLYPVRKHARWARGLGPVRHWFRGHMLLGILGPACILLHCNFRLGSVNGTVALFSMLLVAGSGLVGRFIYSKVHYGLYGRKADLAGLGCDTEMARAELGPVFKEVPAMKARLQRIEEKAVSARSGFLSSLGNMLIISIRSRWCLLVSLWELRRFFNTPLVCRRLTRDQRRYYHRKAKYYLHNYLYTVRKVAGFSLFERLLSLWHILHLPLFFMLLIAGLVHVYAVHMY